MCFVFCLFANHDFNPASWIQQLPNGAGAKFGEARKNLSGGEKQKIAVIRELSKNSSLFLLDEPTSAMDSASKEELLRIVSAIKKDKIIIIATHDEEVIEIADQVICI